MASAKGYAIKLPSGLIDEDSVRSNDQDCRKDFERDADHCWQELETRGYQCVPVTIQEVKE